MTPRNTIFINDGQKLNFDAVSGFAENPQGDNAICFAADSITQVLSIDGTGTVIVYGTNQKTPPDFTAPVTIDNFFVPIQLADYSLANTYYNGSVGAVVSSSSMMVELNTNLLTWVAIHRSANTVEVKLTETDNQ